MLCWVKHFVRSINWALCGKFIIIVFKSVKKLLLLLLLFYIYAWWFIRQTFISFSPVPLALCLIPPQIDVGNLRRQLFVAHIHGVRIYFIFTRKYFFTWYIIATERFVRGIYMDLGFFFYYVFCGNLKLLLFVWPSLLHHANICKLKSFHEDKYFTERIQYVKCTKTLKYIDIIILCLSSICQLVLEVCIRI